MDRAKAAAKISEPVISEAMGRARAVACGPFDERCNDFADTVQQARPTCTPQGRCRIGWITKASGRERSDVWLDVASGEGRLKRRP